ncbi:MAG: LysR substrate-binding domain-containing protein [Salibacteraceae bacterium]
MTIQQLQYVLALNQQRHFVKAAEQANVTQPTLTMQLKKLEEELGYEIFNRTTKPLTPTPMGLLVIEHAQSIIQEIESLKLVVQKEETNVSGTIRIGIIPTLAPYLLPLFLENLRKSYPQLKLVISEMQSEVLIESLTNQLTDIGIIVTPLEQKNLNETPLFYEPFWFYGSEKHKLLTHSEIEAKDIEEESFWILDQGHCFRNQVLNICGSTSGIEGIDYKSGSIETLKRLVDNGDNFTLIPELAILSEAEMSKSRPFKNPKPVREVSMVYSKTFSKKGVLNALQDEIIEALPDSIKSIKRKVRIKWR